VKRRSKSDDQGFEVIARAAVAALAPEELPAFEATARAFAANPKRTLSGRGKADRALDSGLGMAISMLTPAALFVAKAVYDEALSEAAEEIVDRGKDALRRVREHFRRANQAAGHDKDPGLAAMWETAVTRGLEVGLARERAVELADLLILGLTAPDDDDDEA
jgi:hypothetical protein